MYVGLAYAYVDMGVLNIAPFKVTEEAKQAAETALQINPTSPTHTPSSGST